MYSSPPTAVDTETVGKRELYTCWGAKQSCLFLCSLLKNARRGMQEAISWKAEGDSRNARSSPSLSALRPISSFGVGCDVMFLVALQCLLGRPWKLLLGLVDL